MKERTRDDLMEVLKNRKLTALAVLLSLLAAPQTRGNGAYLKQIGPPPLRFSPALACLKSFTLPFSLIERAAPTNVTQIASASAKPVETTVISSPSPSIPPPAATTSVPPIPDPTPTPAPSASVMLPVSPQMLTEFFKPGADGTNAAPAVILPVAVGFTPPSVKPASRATYNSP